MPNRGEKTMEKFYCLKILCEKNPVKWMDEKQWNLLEGNT
jgi:hypothetical protein